MVNAGKWELAKQEMFWRGNEGGSGLFGKQQSTLLVFRKVAE